MDYKEKYENAVNELRNSRNRLMELNVINADGIINANLERIFPELRESEDERIRKELLSLFEDGRDGISHRYTGSDCERYIAWLKKQGSNLVENSYTNNKDIIKYADNYSHAIWHKLMDNFKNIKDYRIGYNDVSDIVLNAIIDAYNWLEKKGEQKPAEVRTTGYWNVQDIEQKPAESPKFKAGDIIKHNTANIINKVVSVNSTGSYHVENIVTGGRMALSYAEQNYHLWTIQDAKDGDVLYTSSTASNEVFIFKRLSKEGNIECYCSYDSEDKYCEGKYHFIGKPDFTTHPATKEKYDLLFSKMKEAGYEWDVEKKELKKIKRKSAWSEEDEVMLDNILNDEMCPLDIETMNWLKSLKDRMALTNKNDFDRGYEVGVSAAKFNQWKPTEEQMSYFASAIERFDFCDPEHAALEAIYTHFKNLQNQ